MRKVVGSGQFVAIHRFNASLFRYTNSGQQYLHRESLSGVGIHNLDEYLLTICRAADNCVQGRNVCAFECGRERWSLQRAGQPLSAEMRSVEHVYEISRRDKYSMAAALDDASAPSIHHVGDRTHLNQFASALKYIHQ